MHVEISRHPQSGYVLHLVADKGKDSVYLASAVDMNEALAHGTSEASRRNVPLIRNLEEQPRRREV